MIQASKLVRNALVLIACTAAHGSWGDRKVLPPDPPTATLKLTKTKATSGAKFQGILTLTFADGLHGYQNPPSRDYMIPVALSTPTKGFALTAKYPKGVSRMVAGESEPALVYEGKIEIPVTMTAPKKLGKTKFSITVKYQQCDHGTCYPPDSIEIATTIEVAKAQAAPPAICNCPCIQSK